MENQEKNSKQIAQDILKKSRENEYAKKIKGARTVLLIIGVLNILVGIYYYFQPFMKIEGYFAMGLGAVFIGLYFLGVKKPMLALVSGLVIFLTIHILSAILDPETIVKGIILKVIFIVLLVRGITSVHALPKPKPAESNDLLDDF
ncbi:MAG: hypothetical protein AB8B72_11110 [Crocinitomicaceae bacterium]